MISKVSFLWGGIGLGGKASKAFLVYEYSKRWTSSNEYVDTEVKFESVNQSWFMNISLSDTVFNFLDLFQVTSKEYSFSLGRSLWFNNKCFWRFFDELLFENIEFLWKTPSSWEKRILNRKQIPNCV